MNTLPSNRSFGFLLTGVFLLLAAYGWHRGSNQYVIYGWLSTAAIFASVALLAPSALTPLNKAWFLLGTWLGKIVNPLVLGVVFFAVITPVAIIARLWGRDVLRLNKQPAGSYWIDRDPPGPPADSFKNQF